MPDTYYSGEPNSAPNREKADPASNHFDGHVSIEVEGDPHVHAQKLHALIAGLDAVHEADGGEFGTKEQSEIMGWLIYMIRNESAAMMRSFAEEHARRSSNG